MHLLRVLAVVQGEGDDLGRDDRGEQHRLPHRPAPPPLLEEAVGRACVLHDVGAVEHAVACLARRLEAHDFHGANHRTSCIEYRPGLAWAMNLAEQGEPRTEETRVRERWGGT